MKKFSGMEWIMGIISVVLVIGFVVLAITNTPVPSILTQLAYVVFGGLFGYSVQPSKTNSSSSTGSVVGGN